MLLLLLWHRHICVVVTSLASPYLCCCYFSGIAIFVLLLLLWHRHICVVVASLASPYLCCCYYSFKRLNVFVHTIHSAIILRYSLGKHSTYPIRRTRTVFGYMFQLVHIQCLQFSTCDVMKDFKPVVAVPIRTILDFFGQTPPPPAMLLPAFHLIRTFYLNLAHTVVWTKYCIHIKRFLCFMAIVIH